jgi:hypothetical protein
MASNHEGDPHGLPLIAAKGGISSADQVGGPAPITTRDECSRERALAGARAWTAEHWSYNMSFRAILARAAPMAVLTSFVSSGGGRTAGIPSASIHSSRVQPVVW